MFDAVYDDIVICCLICCPNTLLTVMLTLAGQTERKFAFAADCTLEFDTFYYWCSMQYEVVILPSPSSCAVQIHHNDGSALMYVGWIHGTVAVLTLHEQNVRVCECVLKFECVVRVQCSMRSQSHNHALFCCPIHYNGNNASALISNECMQRGLRWIDPGQKVGTSVCLCA